MVSKIIFLILFCLKFVNAQYYCTATNSAYYPHLLKLIGSIHKTNYEFLNQIFVYDLGLQKAEKEYLSKIEKLEVIAFKEIHKDVIKPVVKDAYGRTVPGWYAFKYVALYEVIKKVPIILWIDSGSTVLRPLNSLFNEIEKNGYFFCTIGDEDNGKITHDVKWGMTKFVYDKFDMNSSSKKFILDKEPVMGGVIGVTSQDKNNIIADMFYFAQDLRNYADDGTTPNGFGTSRHDQSLLSAQCYYQNLIVYKQDFRQERPIKFNYSNNAELFYITWHWQYVNEKTHIYSSRHDLSNLDNYKSYIKFK